MLLLGVMVAAWVATARSPTPWCSANWEFVGPTGMEGGIMSASNSIAKVSDGWLLGTVNSGVWKTKDLYANQNKPHWECVTDHQPVNCASIAAIGVSDSDSSLVAAGCGGTSSSMIHTTWNLINSGDWGGVMISRDSGSSWVMTKFPPNYYVTAILFLQPAGWMVVAARSHANDEKKGGVWISKDYGESWTQTLKRPAYHLASPPNTIQVFASLAYEKDAVYASNDGGVSWASASSGLDFSGRTAWFTQLAISTAESTPVVFMAAFTINPNDDLDVSSAVHYAKLDSGNIKWQKISGMPGNLDPDRMAKDRVGILADPKENLLYLAGNQGEIYRINWQQGQWTHMTYRDTEDQSSPHGDCRGWAWDEATGNLLLVQDGGLAVRTSPRKHGSGRWTGLSGDIGVMEFYTAQWDGRLERWIAGAQDNDVQMTKPKSHGDLQSMGVIGGDGQHTAIDNTHCPARCIGSGPMLGGLSVMSGDPLRSARLRVGSKFDDPQAFPYFYPPYALNSQEPEKFFFWANKSDSRAAAIWEMEVPSYGNLSIVRKFPVVNVEDDDNDDKDNDDDDDDDDEDQPQIVLDPQHVVDVGPTVFQMVSGGYTKGKSDPGLLVVVNQDTLWYRTGSSPLKAISLPSKFGVPHPLPFVRGRFVMGPASHGKTVSFAVNPADSTFIVVTGWPSDWYGKEHVWLTTDAGSSWKDIIGNLGIASLTHSFIRPSGLLIIEFSDLKLNAILVGTVSGVFVTWTDNLGTWSQVGNFTNHPLIKVQGLSYEYYSDVLVSSTFGRGVYIMRQAKTMLLKQKKINKVKRHATFPSQPHRHHQQNFIHHNKNARINNNFLICLY